MADTKLFGVRDAAAQAGCCAQSLRNYEARGLIQPLRDSSGKRLFTENDINQIKNLVNKK